MIADIRTIVWKEWRELLVQRGNTRGSLITLLIVIGFFSTILPLQIGRDWIASPFVIVITAWVPIFLVTSVIADSFAGERERHTLETLLASRLSDRAILLGKIAAGVSYGWGLTLIILFAQLVTINIFSGEGQLLFYQGIIGPGSVVISLLSAGLAANVGVLVSLRAPGTRQAQQTLSVVAMALLALPVVLVRAVPSAWRENLSQMILTSQAYQFMLVILCVLLLLNIGLLMITFARFQRTRLILAE